MDIRVYRFGLPSNIYKYTFICTYIYIYIYYTYENVILQIVWVYIYILHVSLHADTHKPTDTHTHMHAHVYNSRFFQLCSGSLLFFRAHAAHKNTLEKQKIVPLWSGKTEFDRLQIHTISIRSSQVTQWFVVTIEFWNWNSETERYHIRIHYTTV